MERRSWMKRMLLVAAGVVGVTTLGAAKLGPGGPHGRHGGPGPAGFLMGPHLDDLLDDVKATDEQRTKIHAIRDQLAQQGDALRTSHKEDLKLFVTQWDAATPDAKALHARIDQRAQAMQAFAHQAADAMVQVHDVLTPDQRAVVSKKLHRRLGE